MKKYLSENRKAAVTGILFTLLAIVLLTGSVFAIRAFISRTVYNEREVYLGAQTETTTSLVKETLRQYQDYSAVCANVVSADLQEGADLTVFLDTVQEKIFLDGARLILVDSSGLWYGENGTSGKITGVTYYGSSTPDSLVYLTKGAGDDTESLVFRVRLKHPVRVTAGAASPKVSYCAVLCSMDTLKNRFSTAFPFTSNRFILDENGLMLYRDFGLGLLMSGSNVFSKYEQVEFTHGKNGAELVSRIRNGETAIGEFLLNGKNYFICSAPLELNSWTVTYLVESDELSTGSYIRPVILFIAVIALFFAAFLVTALILFFHFLRSRNELRLEQENSALLEKVSRAKSEFLSNMSHDIRTPINGIMGMSLMAQKQDNPEKTTEYLHNIDNASRHLLSLVNDVLDMSSIESGKVVLRPIPTDIRTVPVNCVSIIRGQLQNRQLEIREEYAEPVHPVLLLDELRLRQILINLLSNAVKYTPDGGTVTLRLSELPSEAPSMALIHLEVEDNGIGMKPEFLEHIWDQFSQEDGGSRTTYKGTGLGMAITKSYTELMGGTVSVRSELNRGSTFTVEIPFVIADASPEKKRGQGKGNEETEKTTEEERSLRGARVLLVEDNDLNLMIARDILEDEGCTVTPASNGREALDTFVSSPPGTFDLILMDIMMPVMNGLDATKAIRAIDRYDASGIPVIAMTANAFAEDIAASLDAGMNAHLSKPIEVPELIRTLTEFYRPKGDLP